MDVRVPAPEPSTLRPEPLALDVLYEADLRGVPALDVLGARQNLPILRFGNVVDVDLEVPLPGNAAGALGIDIAEEGDDVARPGRNHHFLDARE